MKENENNERRKEVMMNDINEIWIMKVIIMNMNNDNEANENNNEIWNNEK